MSRFAIACCCAFAAALAPAGAQTAPPSSPAPANAATAPSPEAAKIAAAMAKVTSFRVQLSSTGGFGGTITVVPAQKRTKGVMAMGTTVNEMVMADGRAYSRINGGEWRITETPPGAGFTDTVLKAMGDPSKFRLLPDRIENGTAVGVYEVTTPLPAGMPAGITIPPLTCTYDKSTYLPRTCIFQTMTQTFEGWNDPANVIDVPVVASPAPAASPRP
ncbi:MAG TPA: hypothetical protein VGC72_15065 [Candidatus Elarobacter sp.]|jgi:hypothetical protein